MNRRDAVAKLLAARDGALVVTGLGSPSYDVHAAGDRDDHIMPGRFQRMVQRHHIAGQPIVIGDEDMSRLNRAGNGERGQGSGGKQAFEHDLVHSVSARYAADCTVNAQAAAR